MQMLLLNFESFMLTLREQCSVQKLTLLLLTLGPCQKLLKISSWNEASLGIKLAQTRLTRNTPPLTAKGAACETRSKFIGTLAP